MKTLAISLAAVVLCAAPPAAEGTEAGAAQEAPERMPTVLADRASAPESEDEHTPEAMDGEDGDTLTVVVPYTVVVRLPVGGRSSPLDEVIADTSRRADAEGLLREHPIRNAHGETVGIVYHFRSKEAADELIDDEWARHLAARTGVEPIIFRYRLFTVDSLYGD